MAALFDLLSHLPDCLLYYVVGFSSILSVSEIAIVAEQLARMQCALAEGCGCLSESRRYLLESQLMWFVL